MSSTNHRVGSSMSGSTGSLVNTLNSKFHLVGHVSALQDAQRSVVKHFVC